MMNSENLRYKKACDFAFRYASVRGILDYYSYNEFEDQNKMFEDPVIFSLHERLDCAVEAYMQGELAKEAAFDLRRNNTDCMEIITHFTDCFQVYEMVLNHTEGRYTDEYTQMMYDDEIVISDLMNHIIHLKDSAEINFFVQEVVEQLPVRMTKAKFGETVKNALAVYKGKFLSALEDILYILKSSAALSLPEEEMKKHKVLYGLLEEFRNVDFSRMDKPVFEQLQKNMEKAEEILNLYSDYIVQMQYVINDLCIMLCTEQYALTDVAEDELLDDILSGIIKKEDQDILFEKMALLEGRQENYYEQYNKNAEVLERAAEKSAQSDNNACRIVNLMSASTFAETTNMQNDLQTLVTEAVFTDRCETFLKEFNTQADMKSKMIVRSLMARVCSGLPVWFNNLEELEDYIRKALGACTDIYEKNSSIQLIYDLMENTNALV